MVKINELINNSSLFKYLYYSILVTILDVLISWVLYRLFGLNILIANTTGVAAGFVLHYLLSSKSVFGVKYGLTGFTVYLATFLFGLFLSDVLIYIGESNIFKSMQIDIRFLLSKGISIVFPFFILYYLRKVLFQFIKKLSYKDINI